MHVFSITQVAMIALAVRARESEQRTPTTDDQIACAIEFVDLMASDDMNDPDDREAWNDLDYAVERVVSHLEFQNEPEQAIATFLDLVC